MLVALDTRSQRFIQKNKLKSKVSIDVANSPCLMVKISRGK